MDRIRDLVTIKFDPKNLGSSEKDKMTREIFEDDIARTLWLGIAQSHARCQFFNRDCLRAANAIREEGVPDSPEVLSGLIERQFVYGHLYGRTAFAEELLPYLDGRKSIKYNIAS